MPLFTLALIDIQIGVIAAVSGLVAPIVFKVLEPSAAGVFLRCLFPRYFLTAAILGMITFVLAVFGNQWIVAAMMGLDALCFFTALGMVPAINAAKDRGAPSFARLHLVSVVLNMTGLVLAIVAIGGDVLG